MMRSTWTTTLTILSILLQAESTGAANILVLFPFASRSHNNVYSVVTSALAKRGHHLTVVTPILIDPPTSNYVQIDTSNSGLNPMNFFSNTKKISAMELFKNFTAITGDSCLTTFSNPQVKKLVDNNDGKQKFDLIILSTVLTECYYAFAEVYKAPIVLISPNGPMGNTNSMLGNVALPSFVPEILLSYTNKMSFTQRGINAAFHWATNFYHHFFILREAEKAMRYAFGDDVPPFSELEKHVSLLLVNTHFSMNYPQPLVPNCVEVGGLHVKPPKDLPENLKAFMDSAGKDGVIYFSLGSVLQSSNLDKEIINAFVRAFSQVKQRVLWKWEGEIPIQGDVKKIRFEKWLPQQDVLAHPNVVLFITHGGLLSFQEAASRGVPLVGIPHFGDQEANLKRIMDLNVGVKLDADNLTTENILNAINQVLEDPRYSENMKTLKNIVNDQQEHPLERAIYWIEYVLRHKGAKHLRSSSADLQLYQLYMLDILLVIAVLSFTITVAVVWFCKKLIQRKCTSKKRSKDSLKKSQ